MNNPHLEWTGTSHDGRRRWFCRACGNHGLEGEGCGCDTVQRCAYQLGAKATEAIRALIREEIAVWEKERSARIDGALDRLEEAGVPINTPPASSSDRPDPGIPANALKHGVIKG